MAENEVTFKVIGYIRTPFTDQGHTPIQPAFSEADGTVEVLPEYAAGLKDVEGFSHLILIYHFHKVKDFALLQRPFLDGSEERGIFAIRHFRRPNPIGFSVVELKQVRGNVLDVSGIDVLDGTPLLDIKPYIEQFDCRRDVKSGWAQGIDKKGKVHTPDGLRHCDP